MESYDFKYIKPIRFIEIINDYNKLMYEIQCTIYGFNHENKIFIVNENAYKKLISINNIENTFIKNHKLTSIFGIPIEINENIDHSYDNDILFCFDDSKFREKEDKNNE